MGSMTPQQITRPLLMMSMLVVAVFCSMAARVIFSPLMPTLQREMGITLATAGSVFLLISISYGAAMLFSGFLSSRVGHGKAIVVALGAISLGLLVTAVATSFGLLAAGTVLIGAGAGTYPPSGLVMINTLIPIDRRSTAFAFHEVGPNLALLTAPLLVLVLEPWFSWRGVLVWLAAVCALAAAAFLRWGVRGSGTGAAPNLSTVGTILRLRTALLGMVILSAALAGVQGVYAILPAYLVTEHGMSPGHVNLLLAASRVAGIVLLLRAGAVINRIGRRRTIAGVLLFSAAFTALIGLARGTPLAVFVVAQPALLTVLFPAALSSMAAIGEAGYQNVTYSLIITAGIGIGVGIAPTVLGVFGDLGLGWAGFVLLAGYMLGAVGFLWSTPEFGQR